MSVRMMGSEGLRLDAGFVPAGCCCCSCCNCWTCCCCCCSATSTPGTVCSVLDDRELAGGLIGI